MPPNAYSLVSVSARPEKRTIDVTFSSPHGRVMKQYPFFPSLYLPRTSTNVFEKLLKAQSVPRHQIVTHEQSVQILAGTWEDLKQIAHILHAQTKYFPILVEPERQFLLTQNWRYFQTFDEKLNPTPQAFANSSIPGLAEPLHVTLNELSSYDPAFEKTLTQSMVLSHELFIPYTSTRALTDEEQIEIYLTNTLFAAHMAGPLQTGKSLNTENWSMEQRNMAATLATRTPLAGEGNCSCCAPASIFHQHVHAGSMIDTLATQDGVYVHTNHAGLSQTYHESHSGKEKRVARAQEWGLTTLPLGPLRRGEKIRLPLKDAIEGHRIGLLAAEQPPTHATWACTREKFALEKAAILLHERATLHGTLHQEHVQPYLSKYQLAYTLHTRQDPTIRLHHAGETLLREWEGKLAAHLLRTPTAWRDPRYTTLLQAAVGE